MLNKHFHQTYSPRGKNKASSRKKVALLAVVALVALGAMSGGLYAKVHIKHEAANVDAAVASASSSPKKTSNHLLNPDIPQPTPSQNIPGGVTKANSNLELIAPSGTFVSNHKPSLSGNPTPSQETSTCNTTSGATCTIIFQKGGTTKTLNPQKVDKDGAATWTWSVKDLGLTEGSWSITAQASLNGITKTTHDQLALEVGS